MNYQVNIQNSHSGSHSFSDMKTASLFYNATIKGFRLFKDKSTNVELLKRHNEGPNGWETLQTRFAPKSLAEVENIEMLSFSYSEL